MKAGAAFSPTHSASFLPPGTAASSLSNKLSTAIREWEVDRCSIGGIRGMVGVWILNEEERPSGEEEECELLSGGGTFFGDIAVNPPSR
jgi:hypothetical protein